MSAAACCAPATRSTCRRCCRPHFTRPIPITRPITARGRRFGSACRRCSSLCARTPRSRASSMSGSQASSARRKKTARGDNTQIEAGDTLEGEFRAAAALEIRAFKEQRTRERGAGDAADPTDGELLREVMNTVRRRVRLGEQIRCVVSVSMLTEGWDGQHPHPHSRRPRPWHPVIVRAGGWPRPAAAVL
jgi:hypothetical protein